MNDMIERVARAICVQEHVLAYPGASWRPNELDQKVESYWPRHVSAARSAIEAMRQPTDAMARAGGGEGAVNSWHAMITAALRDT